MTRALACAALVCVFAASGPAASAHAPHRRHPHHPRVSAPVDPATPDCRYPDGTPFDPDVIGGPNHVGDGGPAVNLGGFPPCGF